MEFDRAAVSRAHSSVSLRRDGSIESLGQVLRIRRESLWSARYRVHGEERHSSVDGVLGIPRGVPSGLALLEGSHRPAQESRRRPYDDDSDDNWGKSPGPRHFGSEALDPVTRASTVVKSPGPRHLSSEALDQAIRASTFVKSPGGARPNSIK